MKTLVYICELCQTVLEDRGGEEVCPNCGRTLDCTDLGVVRANATMDEQCNVEPVAGSDARDFLPQAPRPGDLVGPPPATEAPELPEPSAEE
jgi:hypothetical protein